MTRDENGWDPARPGVAPNPKESRRHWILIWGIETLCFWHSRWSSWISDTGRKIPVHEMAGAECKYLGPCLTPSEVEARVAEARRAALKEAAKRLEELHRNHGYNSATGQVMRRGEIVTNSNEIDHALGYYRAVSEGVAHILALGEEP